MKLHRHRDHDHMVFGTSHQAGRFVWPTNARGNPVVGEILQLQRAAGNAAVAQLLRARGQVFALQRCVGGVTTAIGGPSGAKYDYGPVQNDAATCGHLTLPAGGVRGVGTTPQGWPSWWQNGPWNAYWVQGHLINMKLGGPGDHHNVTPIPKSANTKHLEIVEAAVKSEADAGNGIDYEVHAKYTAQGPHDTLDVAEAGKKNPPLNLWPSIPAYFECRYTITPAGGGAPVSNHFNVAMENRYAT